MMDRKISQSLPNLYSNNYCLNLDPEKASVEVEATTTMVALQLPSASSAVDRNDMEDYHHGLMEQEYLRDTHDTFKKGQRPLLVGSGLLGLAIACFLYVYPSMLIQEMEVSETKVNHGMALICISAALASPCVAFSNLSILLGISVMAFSAFVTLQIFGPAWHLLVVQGVGGMPGSWHLVVPYLAAGPFLAFMHWGQFCLLAKPKLWLMTFKGWSYVVVGMVLKLTLIQTTNTKNHFTTMMSICLLSLALGGLCQIVYCFSKEPSPKKSKGQVMMLSKSKWRRPYFLTFYVKDNQLHLMLPLVFFLGLFEAFMSKTFLMNTIRTYLGLDQGLCLILGILGASKLISTWLTSQLHQIISTHVILMVLTMFQLALLLLQWLWTPSKDDPMMFFAITFIWGTTSASWDFLILGPSGIGRYTSDPLNWKSAVAVTSLHYFAGMAIIFGLAIETPILALVFVVTLIPFWCLSRRTTTTTRDKM